MRGIAIVVVLGACAPHFDRAAHSGRDADPWGAHQLEIEHGEARAHGIVTARGGDADDWFAFEVPDQHGCPQEIEVKLRWRTPRPELRLALAVYDLHQRKLAPTRRDPHSRVAVIHAHPGDRFFAKVFAPRHDDAGEYKLDVRAEPWQCDLGPPPIELIRPPGYRTPALAPTLDHEIADVTRIRIDGDLRHGVAWIAAGSARGIDEHWWGQLVDRGGNVVPDSTFLVRNVSADLSTGELLHADAMEAAAAGGDVWTAVLTGPRVMPEPVELDPTRATIDARLSSVSGLSSGDVLVELDRGRADGVQLGWRGVLAYASDVRVPGSHFVVIDVSLHRSIGLVTQLVITDPDHLHAVLTSP